MRPWHLGTRAKIYGKDGSHATTTFNQMADTVENHTRNLEFQILERTHELQSANKLLADLNERLNELAITDGLTGLFNFRQFQDTIRKELVRAKRLRIPFSLLAMDVDFFKQFNDTYGHPSGDIALKKLASVMKERLRESDILCRIGGEEFSAILPGTWHEAAIGLAQELRMSLEKSELINEAGQKIPGITISIGVATFPDHADNVSDLINAADSALYLAKQRAAKWQVPQTLAKPVGTGDHHDAKPLIQRCIHNRYFQITSLDGTERRYYAGRSRKPRSCPRTWF